MILLSDQRRDLFCRVGVLASDLVEAGPREEVGNEEFGLLLMAILGPVRGADRLPIQRLNGFQR